MSIKDLEKIEDTESERYRSLVNNINTQFEKLYRTLNHYSIKESGFYLTLAYKCFEKEIAKELQNSPQ